MVTNGILLILAAGLSFGIGRYAQTQTGQFSAILMGFGVLIALISWFQSRLEEQERVEKLEFDELNRQSGTASLFNQGATETLASRRSLELFERFFIPTFTGLVALAQAGVAIWGWQRLSTVVAGPPQQGVLALGLFGGVFLVLFLIGQYSAGVARLDDRRLLRPGANWVLLGAYLAAITAAVLGAMLAEVPKADILVARLICILLGVLALEGVATVVLDIYRPRIRGRAVHALYDSRLVGLLSHPEGVFSTAASALDYQFGFKVSETWFYTFVRTNLAWLVLAQLALFSLSTSFVFIEPGEQALLERLGRPVPGREVLGPGLHLKLPYPIDLIHRHRTDEVQSFIVGAIPRDDGGPEPAFLWSAAHYKEEYNLITPSSALAGSGTNSTATNTPLSLLTASVPIHYQISNLRDYAYNFENAGEVLQKVANHVVVKYFAGSDVHQLLSNGQSTAADAIGQEIQKRIDELKLGVKLLFVGLQDIHPPLTVVREYEAVVSARQWAETNRWDALTYANQTNTLASAEASRILGQATVQGARVTGDARGRAARFKQQQVAHAASPEVYSHRLFLRSYTNGLADARKVIIALTNFQLTPQLDLQQRISDDMLRQLMPPKTQ